MGNFIGLAALISATLLVVVAANGAVIGLIAWVAGYAAEAGLLAFRLRRLDRRAARDKSSQTP